MKRLLFNECIFYQMPIDAKLQVSPNLIGKFYYKDHMFIFTVKFSRFKIAYCCSSFISGNHHCYNH